MHVGAKEWISLADNNRQNSVHDKMCPCRSCTLLAQEFMKEVPVVFNETELSYQLSDKLAFLSIAMMLHQRGMNWVRNGTAAVYLMPWPGHAASGWYADWISSDECYRIGKTFAQENNFCCISSQETHPECLAKSAVMAYNKINEYGEWGLALGSRAQSTMIDIIGINSKLGTNSLVRYFVTVSNDC